MKIALIGYGKMGRAIEQEALQRGHEIAGKYDSSTADFTADKLKHADVAIEFTRPEVAVDNIYKCFDAHVPVVVGTTGWYSRFNSVKQDCMEKNAAMFTATNYSIGVNVLFAVNKYLARIMNHHPEYAVNIEEIHHTQKLDAPSGTAISLAGQVLHEIDRLENWGLVERDSIGEATLPIRALREDEVPGIHEVTYRSAIDEIQLKHSAFSRKGFALGAVIAAEWLAGKKGVFGMDDMLKF